MAYVDVGKEWSKEDFDEGFHQPPVSEDEKQARVRAIAADGSLTPEAQLREIRRVMLAGFSSAFERAQASNKCVKFLAISEQAWKPDDTDFTIEVLEVAQHEVTIRCSRPSNSAEKIITTPWERLYRIDVLGFWLTALEPIPDFDDPERYVGVRGLLSGDGQFTDVEQQTLLTKGAR